jgi:hypothetical protein
MYPHADELLQQSTIAIPDSFVSLITVFLTIRALTKDTE